MNTLQEIVSWCEVQGIEFKIYCPDTYTKEYIKVIGIEWCPRLVFIIREELLTVQTPWNDSDSFLLHLKAEINRCTGLNFTYENLFPVHSFSINKNIISLQDLSIALADLQIPSCLKEFIHPTTLLLCGEKPRLFVSQYGSLSGAGPTKIFTLYYGVSRCDQLKLKSYLESIWAYEFGI